METIPTYSWFTEAYNNLNLDHAEMSALGIGLGAILAIVNCFREVGGHISTKGYDIDVSQLLGLLKANIPTFALILFMPVGLNLLESIFGAIEQSYLEQMDYDPMTQYLENDPDTEALLNQLDILNNPFDNMLIMWEYFKITSIRPFIMLLDQWAYSFALFYRFLMLFVLQMLSGVALACNIYEPTRKYFETWLKNLFLCYLLVPGFMIVTSFCEEIRQLFLLQYTNPMVSIDLIVLLLLVLFKFYGYAQIKNILTKVVA